MLKITLYTQPRCGQCEATKAYLDNKRADYDVMPMTDSVREVAYGLGILTAPLVVTYDSDTERFGVHGGHNINALDEIINSQYYQDDSYDY